MFPFPRQGSSHPQSLMCCSQRCFLWKQPTRSVLLQDASTRHHGTDVSFVAEDLPVLTGPAKSFLPHFACDIPFSTTVLWTGLQFCGSNETLQLLTRTWKTGNLVTLNFLQQLFPYPALTTLHLIAKWQRIFPLPSIKSSAVPKLNGITSWKNLVWLYEVCMMLPLNRSTLECLSPKQLELNTNTIQVGVQNSPQHHPNSKWLTQQAKKLITSRPDNWKE